MTSHTSASNSSLRGPSSTSNTSMSTNTTSSLRVAEARRALEASMHNIGSSMTTELSARAQNLHANTKALEKQEKDLAKETAKLKKENDKLAKEAERGSKTLKELGNVQNWAEILERDFLVLRETLRLVREGSDDSWSSSGSGSWTEDEGIDRGMEVLVENWEEDVDGECVDMAAMAREVGLPSSTEPCKVCDDGEKDGQVLLCDGCAAAYHAACVGLHMAPEGTWYCAPCKGKGRDETQHIMDETSSRLDDLQLGEAHMAPGCEPHTAPDIEHAARVNDTAIANGTAIVGDTAHGSAVANETTTSSEMANELSKKTANDTAIEEVATNDNQAEVFTPPEHDPKPLDRHTSSSFNGATTQTTWENAAVDGHGHSQNVTEPRTALGAR